MFNLLKKNKIFIPFENYQGVGGPTTFMSNLKIYLDDTGFSYSTSLFFAKNSFITADYPPEMLRKLKKRGGKIIQRLDGIFYYSQHGSDFEKMNSKMKEIYQELSDFVIFQSEYSRRQCFSMLGERRNNEYVVVHNGVNKIVFYPSQKEKNRHKRTIFIMSGSFRKEAMIEPVVLALDSLKGKFDFELQIAGPVIEDRIRPFFERPYIKMLGSLNHGQLAEALRLSDIFIHSQLNDNCPNSVLEAVSCGLPVVGFDSGVMSELTFFSRELLAPVNDEIFQKYEDFDWRKLAEKIEYAIENLEECRAKAMEHHELYSFEECGAKYVEVFNKVMNNV